MDLVQYISKNSVITMQEINTVEEALQSPMTHFDNLREHLGIMVKNELPIPRSSETSDPSSHTTSVLGSLPATFHTILLDHCHMERKEQRYWHSHIRLAAKLPS